MYRAKTISSIVLTSVDNSVSCIGALFAAGTESNAQETQRMKLSVEKVLNRCTQRNISELPLLYRPVPNEDVRTISFSDPNDDVSLNHSGSFPSTTFSTEEPVRFSIRTDDGALQHTQVNGPDGQMLSLAEVARVAIEMSPPVKEVMFADLKKAGNPQRSTTSAEDLRVLWATEFKEKKATSLFNTWAELPIQYGFVGKPDIEKLINVIIEFKKTFSDCKSVSWFVSSKIKYEIPTEVYQLPVLVSPFVQQYTDDSGAHQELVLTIQDIIHIFKRFRFHVSREEVKFFFNAWKAVATSGKTKLTTANFRSDLRSVPKVEEFFCPKFISEVILNEEHEEAEFVTVVSNLVKAHNKRGLSFQERVLWQQDPRMCLLSSIYQRKFRIANRFILFYFISQNSNSFQYSYNCTPSIQTQEQGTWCLT